MDLEHACLDEGDEALEIGDGEHRLILADIDAAYRIAHPLPGVLGIEARLGETRRTAHQAHHPALHMRQDPLGDAGIEFGKALLGDADGFPQDSLGVSEAI